MNCSPSAAAGRIVELVIGALAVAVAGFATLIAVVVGSFALLSGAGLLVGLALALAGDHSSAPRRARRRW